MNKRGKLAVSSEAKSSPSKTTQSSLSKYFGAPAKKNDDQEDKKTETTSKVKYARTLYTISSVNSYIHPTYIVVLQYRKKNIL